MKAILLVGFCAAVSLSGFALATEKPRIAPSPSPSPTSSNVFPQSWASRDVAWKGLRIHLEQKFDEDAGVEAKVEIRKGTQLLKSLALKGLQPVGGTAGLALPEKQPLDDHFMISKEGDYDPRIILIDLSGRKVASLPAAELYLSPNGRNLFAFQQSFESALPEYAVYDLAQNLLIMEAKDTDKVEPYFVSGIGYRLYAKGGRYLAVARPEVANDPGRARKLAETSMTEINLEMKSLRVLPLEPKVIAEAIPMRQLRLDAGK